MRNDNSESRAILRTLIQGCDPQSGDPVPRDSIIHRTDVLRAMLAGLAALELTAARAQRRAQLPEKVGQAWTTEEEKELVTAFKSGESPERIARKHGRTLRAIEARLEKLGLITAEERTTRGGFSGVS